MWGQGKLNFGEVIEDRIIPTRVGTRLSQNIKRWLREDHPHACGDKFIMRSLFVVSLGSSPRVWGQDRQLAGQLSRIGIIPTRVGTSALTLFLFFGVEDHPHACGDKSYITTICEHPIGSSPRVWGQESVLE